MARYGNTRPRSTAAEYSRASRRDGGITHWQLYYDASHQQCPVPERWHLMTREPVLLARYPEPLAQGSGIALEVLTAWGHHSIVGPAGSTEFGG
jgi:hypothetical protein